jgi:uncharacterized protein (DUF488 family)
MGAGKVAMHTKAEQKVRLYTIGHSNRDIERFTALLAEFGIERLVDIRRFPSSRKWPHFNQQPLREHLEKVGIAYCWAESLGGRRKGRDKDSPNTGLRSAGFRNYADYTATEEFRQAANDLIEQASRNTTAVMCAEKLFWKCHRRILSDYLLARGVNVIHIIEPARSQAHKLSDLAEITEEGVIYPPDDGQGRLFEA